MSGIYETAYPKFKPNLTEKELTEIYTPSSDELNFVHQRLREHENCLLPLVYIKTGQRLGYFVSIADVPNEIVIHIANVAEVGNFCKNELHLLLLSAFSLAVRCIPLVNCNLFHITDKDNL